MKVVYLHFPHRSLTEFTPPSLLICADQSGCSRFLTALQQVGSSCHVTILVFRQTHTVCDVFSINTTEEKLLEASVRQFPETKIQF